MAAPRCARTLLGSATRIQVATPWVAPVQTFSRSKSTYGDGPGRKPPTRRRKRLRDNDKILDESLPLEERLADAGMSPLEYKQLFNSEKRAREEFEEWVPKSREEAEQKWKELQAKPDHFEMLDMYRNRGIEPIKLAKERGITLPTDEPPLDEKTQKALDELRQPINVQAVNLRPLRRSAQYGIPCCDLQLRTYSIRNLLLFADFAVRAAYYMGLSARGPVPLPRITERWTVPRSNFIFKKSQENFERITMRRLIQIVDGHPDVVKAWLAFLAKHQYHGVGMKANIWEYESLEDALGVGKEIKEGEYTGRREAPMLDKVQEILQRPEYKEAMKEYKNPVQQRA